MQVGYRDHDESGSDGTFQTFTRLNGTNTDSGADLIATSSQSDPCGQNSTQAINVADTVKGGATTLEVGVVKDGTDTSAVRVGAIRAVVNYTAVTGETIVETPFTYDISRAPFVSGSCNWAGETINNVSSSAFTPGSDMAPGTYCWRVRTLDVHGLAGAWSGHWTLTIESVAVNVPPVATNDDASGNEDTAGRDPDSTLLTTTPTAMTANAVADAVTSPSAAVPSSTEPTSTSRRPRTSAVGPGELRLHGLRRRRHRHGHGQHHLTCVNDPPVATNDDASGTRTRCSTIAKATLLSNDTDGDDSTLTLTAVSNPSAAPWRSADSTSIPADRTSAVEPGELRLHGLRRRRHRHGHGHHRPDLRQRPAGGGQRREDGHEDAAATTIDMPANDTDADSDPKTVDPVTRPTAARRDHERRRRLTYEPADNY